MRNLICPLSGSSEVILIEKIKVKDIINIYKKQLKFDVSEEFKEVKEIGFYHCLDSDLRFFFPLVIGSEAFYEKLQQFDWYYMDNKPEYEYAKQFVKDSDVVLEIGSGKGAFLKKLSTNNYVGLEFSREATNIAAKEGICIQNESIQTHAIKNLNTYDVVCAFQVLEHVEEVYSFIESSTLCLKPGGLLIYSIPSVDSFSKYVSNFILDMPPHHVTRWSDKALQNIACYFTLEPVEIWHEPLQLIHKKLYAEAVIKNSFFSFFKKPHKNIDKSFTNKVVNGFSKIISQFTASGLTSYELMPRGISVTSVYRKVKK
ncbi:class I SAM-dependent methyltransferase [Microcoleus sp. FACHB-672]|uniref:class I SAM-dependent methyltransferase n=1 Tax=Microcoleus sp. FACHB-672 TaxID=2692825 RepID=UPI001684807B|nr:methyltransferase domain-containing protein [Microcoleus sp. FACHB-672]MBD2040285.1 class I SAM-dependent methyltransferase [Microcoleus sp. FACHB-672]